MSRTIKQTTSYYSVVQYVPDPISDERMNVGVIVFAGEKVFASFLRNWTRARSFGREDIGFLKEFALRFEDAISGQLKLTGIVNDNILNEDKLRDLLGGWINSIQFTEPRASIKDPRSLTSHLATRFLTQVAARHRARDRRTAARIAAERIELALEAEIGEVAREMVQRRHVIKGRVEDHRFDVVVGNGRPLLGAQGLSFEPKDFNVLDTQVDATAWQVEDVRRRNEALPLAILALPPQGECEPFERARYIFGKLDTTLLVEDEMDDWATETVAQLPQLA